MTDHARVEVFALNGGGWHWRAVIGDIVVAQSVVVYETPERALAHIYRVFTVCRDADMVVLSFD